MEYTATATQQNIQENATQTHSTEWMNKMHRTYLDK